MSLPGRDFVPWCASSPAGAGSHARGAEGGGPHHHPGHGADWPSAVAVAVPGPMAGPGLQLVPPCMGIILLNPSERHSWMRLEPPSGSPISPGAESSAGGGTAAILGREASVPPATCLLLPAPAGATAKPALLLHPCRGTAKPWGLSTRPMPWARRGVGSRRWQCPQHPAPSDAAGTCGHDLGCSPTMASTGTGDWS